MSTADLLELAAYMEWADAVVWRAVLRNGDASGDQRIRGLLHHVHTVQQAFLHVWRDEPAAIGEPGEFDDAAALARWGRQGHSRIQDFIRCATSDALGRAIVVPWTAGLEAAWQRKIEHPTLAQTVVQLAMHSAHHRGQILARLRELGASGDLADFIVWVWLGKPGAAWPDSVPLGVNHSPGR